VVLSQFTGLMAGNGSITIFSFFFSPYFFNSSLQSIKKRPHEFATVVSHLAHLLYADVFQLAVGFICTERVSALLCVHGSLTCTWVPVCAFADWGVID